MKLTLFIFGFFLAAAHAQAPNNERRLRAREIIDAHYFEEKSESTFSDALSLLNQNIESPEADLLDYLTLAYAHFVKNDQLGKQRTEEDLGEAQNILSRAKLKFPKSSEVIFFSYYYSLFSTDRYKKELAATDMLQNLKAHHNLPPDLQAIYTLSIGAVSESKSQMQKYLDQHETDPTKRAYFLDLYGNLLILSRDATLAKLCVETFERAITDKPEIALYYVKAAHCAARGLDFERSHLYYKNAYELKRETLSYKKTYSDSLLVQYIMKQESWEPPRLLQLVKDAYKLSPSKESFAVLLGASLKFENKDEQIKLLNDGEVFFKDNLFEFYQFLYHNQKDEDANNRLRPIVLSKIIEFSPTRKHAVLYSYVAFLESLKASKGLSYDRDSYATAFKKARNYMNDPETDCSICQSIMSSLYLFQFLQTENITKLRLSDQIIQTISADDHNIVSENVRSLLQQIVLKINFRDLGIVDRLKSFAGSVLKKYLDLHIIDYTVEKKMYSSTDYYQKISSFQFPEDRKDAPPTQAEDDKIAEVEDPAEADLEKDDSEKQVQ